MLKSYVNENINLKPMISNKLKLKYFFKNCSYYNIIKVNIEK